MRNITPSCLLTLYSLLMICAAPASTRDTLPSAGHDDPSPPALATAAQVVTATQAGTAARTRDAAAWLDAALSAMGGRVRLEALRSVASEGYGSEHALEQSERPEGPWIAGISEFSEVFDVRNDRLALTETARNTLAPSSQPATTLVADGVAARPRGDRVVPLPETFRRPLVERMELGPERLLLTAAQTPAGELTLDGPVLFQGVPHVRVGFPWRGLRVAIVLNTRTALPSAVELIGAYPDDNMLGMWGDMTRRVEYSYWTLESGDLRYPRQWNVYENDQQRAMRTVTALELDVAVDEATFAPLADVAAPPADAAPQPTRRTLTPFDVEDPVELAPGIVQVRSWWNTLLVDQGDAVVVIEGALSSEYSERVLELVAQRFAKPVRAVISTSDAWPHIGGLRAYVAHGIPVLTHPLNRPLLGRLFTASYDTAPDLLQRQPRPAQIRGIGEALRLGSGANRLLVAPIAGEWSERMLMVYFPEHELLYGSDLVFPPNPPYSETYFMPIYLDELATAARREGFAPQRVIAMHAAPVAWAEILAEIDRVAR